MKSTVIKMKNSLERFKSRSEQAEKEMRELEVSERKKIEEKLKRT